MKFTIEEIDDIALYGMNPRHGSFVYNLCLTWRSADRENKKLLHEVMEKMISKYHLYSESVDVQ